MRAQRSVRVHPFAGVCVPVRARVCVGVRACACVRVCACVCELSSSVVRLFLDFFTFF